MKVYVVTDWHHGESQVFGVYLSEAKANSVYSERVSHLWKSGSKAAGYSCSVDEHTVDTEGIFQDGLATP